MATKLLPDGFSPPALPGRLVGRAEGAGQSAAADLPAGGKQTKAWQQKRKEAMTMTPPRPGSLKDLLLLVAAESFHDVWTLEDLTIHAHFAFPDHFGLYGHCDFPDSHCVHGVLYGARGLVARQFVERANGVDADHPFFRLSALGRQVVEQRRRQNQGAPALPKPVRKLAAPPETEAVVAVSLTPTAEELNLFRIGKTGEAILRLITRCRKAKQPVTGKEAEGALQRADTDCNAVLAAQDAEIAPKRVGGL